MVYVARTTTCFGSRLQHLLFIIATLWYLDYATIYPQHWRPSVATT